MQNEINEINEIKRELQTLEELQTKMDRKIKDTAAYKESNSQLTSIIKVSIISIVIIVLIFCAALVFTFMKSQADLYNLLSNGSFETITTTQELEANDSGTIIKDISNSNINSDEFRTKENTD